MQQEPLETNATPRYPHLRLARGGRQYSWTLQEIEAGLQKFKDEFGRYPSAYEVDAYEYLPSCRSLERSHGGYKRIRDLLHLPIVHAGEHRSALQRNSNARGKKIEWKLYVDLVALFGEEFVHREAPLGQTSWTRLDCLVYTKTGKFGVDIFHASHPRSVKIIVNIKTQANKNYTKLGYPVFLVIDNDVMTQRSIDEMEANKKFAMPQNVAVYTRETFFRVVRDQYTRLQII